MRGLFLLAVLSASARAGVIVAPVESAIAPAGPSVVAPVVAPGGLLPSAPLGASFDLRGSLPLLPAPIPGLAGPALGFVGETRAAEAAPAQVRPDAAPAPSPAPAPEHAARARAPGSLAPALPARPSPGGATPALSREREERAFAAGAAAPAARGRAQEPAARPLAEAASAGRAAAESDAGAGRRFFDQGADRSGLLDDGSSQGGASAAGTPSEAVAGGHAPAAVLAAAAGGASSFGSAAAGRGARGLPLAPAGPERGEVLRDAVASPFVPAAPGARVLPYRSAAPNGELAAASPAPAFGGPSAPRPLALDLSGSGLVVRVRSALNSVMPGRDPAESGSGASSPYAPAAAAPSTALLERGGLLEAFAVAGAASAAEPLLGSSYALSPSAARGSAPAALPAAPLAPARPSAGPSVWWALLALPLLALAGRSFL